MTQVAANGVFWALAHSSDKKPRGKGKPFPKGVSGNPAGRPKGFSTRIRELTDNCEEMIQIALRVARGEYTVTRVADDGKTFEVGPTPREVMDACKWLVAYGIGQPPQAPAEDEVKKLTDAELEAQVASMMREKKANHRGSEVVQ